MGTREDFFKRNIKICSDKIHTYQHKEVLFIQRMVHKFRFKNFHISKVTQDEYNQLQMLANPNS